MDYHADAPYGEYMLHITNKFLLQYFFQTGVVDNGYTVPAYAEAKYPALE